MQNNKPLKNILNMQYAVMKDYEVTNLLQRFSDLGNVYPKPTDCLWHTSKH